MTEGSDLEVITQQFEAAWNAHDMQAFGELFDADAIFVGRFATVMRGREAIVSTHQKIHETTYRGSAMTVDRPDVDLLTENIAAPRQTRAQISGSPGKSIWNSDCGNWDK